MTGVENIYVYRPPKRPKLGQSEKKSGLQGTKKNWMEKKGGEGKPENYSR